MLKFYRDAMDEKENKGKLTWTIGLYGTQAMADEAALSLEDYWRQIIKACFLDEDEPVKHWQTIFAQMEETRQKLNKLDIKKVHVTGKDVDLHISIGEKRKWVAGSGRNIPSFEIFTTPDWRGINGWIKFNQPLYYHGVVVNGIELEFKDGVVVSAKAAKNEKTLKDMLAVKNADRLGEFSMTDSRFSRITKFMANTLYDENIGGRYGNSHVALGNALQDAYDGDPSKMTKTQWKMLDFNDCALHTDIITKEDRVVVAELADGSKKIIYKDGMFSL